MLASATLAGTTPTLLYKASSSVLIHECVRLELVARFIHPGSLPSVQGAAGR